MARVGGDEFAALLPKLQDVTDATRIAEKIRHALNRPFELAGRVCWVMPYRTGMRNT